MNDFMEKREWQPIPLSVPDLPSEPPPDRYPKQKTPEMDDHLKQKDEMGDGIVVGGQKNRDEDGDDRLWNPFKSDDEL